MKNRKIYQIIIIWIAVLAVLLVPRIYEKPQSTSAWKFIRVVDGDTLLVEQADKVVSVRLIGVDAPESVHPDEEQNTDYGQRAAAYLESILTDVSHVYLETDEEIYDVYGRMLAYVYLEETTDFSKSMNYRLVAEGYAIAREYPPNVRHARELEMVCAQAKEEERGLWQEENPWEPEKNK